jgi:hypothetical protein
VQRRQLLGLLSSRLLLLVLGGACAAMLRTKHTLYALK